MIRWISFWSFVPICVNLLASATIESSFSSSLLCLILPHLYLYQICIFCVMIVDEISVSYVEIVRLREHWWSAFERNLWNKNLTSSLVSSSINGILTFCLIELNKRSRFTFNESRSTFLAEYDGQGQTVELLLLAKIIAYCSNLLCIWDFEYVALSIGYTISVGVPWGCC